MAEHEIATALELMQGGLKFSSYPRIDDGREFRLWKWRLRLDTHNGFKTQLDAVCDFCRWYAQIRVVKDEPQPTAFDVDKFMMDGIEALCLAAAEETRTRGQEFDAETVAGALARAWHGYDGVIEALRKSGLEFIEDGAAFRWAYNNYVSEDVFSDKETAILDFMATVAMEFRTP